MINEFTADVQVMERLDNEADSLQKKFDEQCEYFKRKYNDGIFEYKGVEYVFSYITAFNHSFTLGFKRINKRVPHKATLESFHLYSYDFPKLTYKNETLEERRMKHEVKNAD